MFQFIMSLYNREKCQIKTFNNICFYPSLCSSMESGFRTKNNKLFCEVDKTFSKMG